MSIRQINMEEFTDCTIIVDSTKFECHKVILSSYSDFFHAMFLSKEPKSREFHLQDVTPVIFKIFRDNVYKKANLGILTLSNYDTQTVITLFECGNLWSTPTIYEPCAAVLVSRAEYKTKNSADRIALLELGFKHNNKTLIDTVYLLRNLWLFKGNNVTYMFNEDIFKKVMDLLGKICHVGGVQERYKDYFHFNRYLLKNTANDKNESS